ncbi:NAD-dependent epimerase/dehydratase family protein [Aestuariibaculum suncheonense]|uniref:NAD-dependent epimerase/dehydratase family protein n=1 Tax=Aestuariibaculum suncheonense TaxID=1028745 RepID=A0A8J6U9F0_9FLAO|nr:NAD-dependent epimerase/dehydratase family protein [Aestuariibaculum suncheonense]MBD0834103.1 NAD-dependent epimerase/dehydratase family protein [Aestuariibaculum suncheonense]
MILVTGGTGLVGSHLLYKLVSNNEKVRAIYRTEAKLAQVNAVFANYTESYENLFNAIEWIKADLLDIPALEDAFTGIDYVYHCAAFVSFEPDKYQLLRKTNIEGTANIVNICLAKNIKKLCYVSSIAALGKPINNATIDEETAWNPEDDNNVYAITKYGAEIEVWRGTQEGLNAVIVNPGVILGAGIWKYGSGSLFKRAYKGIKYYTSGTIGLVDVKDVTNILIQLMASNINNERFVLVAETWHYKNFLQSLATSVNAKIPKKLASKKLLNLAWRLDWVKHKLTGKRRQLTKHLTTTLTSNKTYSNTKIKTALNYEFKAVSDSITEVGYLFLKEV